MTNFVFRSSAIVVGIVKSVRMGREGVPARKVPALLLDEVFVEVDIENAVLGDVKQQQLRLSYSAGSLVAQSSTRSQIGSCPAAELRTASGQAGNSLLEKTRLDAALAKRSERV